MTQTLPTGAQVFEDHAQDYDAWFDSAKGVALFDLELDCLRTLKAKTEATGHSGQSTWLEVGVGSGRFAKSLDIGNGVDPSPAMAKLAQVRGIDTAVGFGEDLPYQANTFDGVLIVCTICFVTDARLVLKECHRVLKPGGHLLMGFVPLESLWGQYHSIRGKAGHTYYAQARFFSTNELIECAQMVGFAVQDLAHADLPAPASDPKAYPTGMQVTAGAPSFQALLLQKR